jgi:hypothetical protein
VPQHLLERDDAPAYRGLQMQNYLPKTKNFYRTKSSRAGY